MDRPPESLESLSLAGLAEQLTCELERTGRIDAARWARAYSEWQWVIFALSPLLLELARLAEAEAEAKAEAEPQPRRRSQESP